MKSTTDYLHTHTVLLKTFLVPEDMKPHMRSGYFAGGGSVFGFLQLSSAQLTLICRHDDKNNCTVL